jgi:hypothetical protein
MPCYGLESGVLASCALMLAAGSGGPNKGASRAAAPGLPARCRAPQPVPSDQIDRRRIDEQETGTKLSSKPYMCKKGEMKLG